MINALRLFRVVFLAGICFSSGQAVQAGTITGVVANTSGDPNHMAQNLKHIWQQAQDRYVSAHDRRDPETVWNGLRDVVNMYKYKANRCYKLWGSTYQYPFQFTLPELGPGRGEIYIFTEDSNVTAHNTNDMTTTERAFMSELQALVGRGSRIMIYLAIYHFDDGREPVGAAVGLKFNRMFGGSYAKPEFVAYRYKYGGQVNAGRIWVPAANLLTYNINNQKLRWGPEYHQPEVRLLMKQLPEELQHISSLLYRSVTKYELGFMDKDRCIK